MQQGSGAVISIRRCQSIPLFNTSINKSDWCCGPLPPPLLPGHSFWPGGEGRGEGKLWQGSPRRQRPARPCPAPSSSLGPALGSGPGSSPTAWPGAGGGRRSRRDAPRRLPGSGRAESAQPAETPASFFVPTRAPETRRGGGGAHTRLEPGPGPPVLADLYLGFTYLRDTTATHPHPPRPPSHPTQL